MAEQPTCGQGLAANAPLRTTLGELVGSTAGVLEIHLASLDPEDETTGPERRAYQRLAQEHREIGARLLVLGEEMDGYRDLPMGRHDFRVMASPPAVEAFGRFVELERDLLDMLQQRLQQDEAMLTQMRSAGREP
jgi:hypothetical protein